MNFDYKGLEKWWEIRFLMNSKIRKWKPASLCCFVKLLQLFGKLFSSGGAHRITLWCETFFMLYIQCKQHRDKFDCLVKLNISKKNRTSFICNLILVMLNWLVENICLVRPPFAPSLNQNKNTNHSNNVDIVFFSYFWFRQTQ